MSENCQPHLNQRMSRIPGPSVSKVLGVQGREARGVFWSQETVDQVKSKENKRERGAMGPPPFPGAVEEGPLYR